MAQKLKGYKVSAVLKVWADCTVDAVDLADAVERSKDLKVTDFVVINEDHLDSSMRITGVQSSDWESIDG